MWGMAIGISHIRNENKDILKNALINLFKVTIINSLHIFINHIFIKMKYIKT